MTVNREKAAALGVTFEEVNNAISTSLGSAYINDFPNRGRMQRVIVQADRNARMRSAGETTEATRAAFSGLLICQSERPQLAIVAEPSIDADGVFCTFMRCPMTARAPTTNAQRKDSSRLRSSTLA
jgi:hypothetical protein